MEGKALGPKNNPTKARLPPRRGQIKIKIFKMMGKSMVSFASMIFNCGKPNRAAGGCLGSEPVVPATTASGFI